MKEKEAVLARIKAQLPTLAYDPKSDIGVVEPKRKGGTKYNTRLAGTSYMQACCKCFKNPSQGACSGHFSEQYVRQFAAESVLADAHVKIDALNVALANMGLYEIRSQRGSREFQGALQEVLALLSPKPEEMRPMPRKKKS